MLKRLCMIIIPMSHQSSNSGMKFPTDGAMMEKVHQKHCIATEGCNLMCSGKLQELLHPQAVFYLIDLLQGAGANKSDMILKSVPCGKSLTASWTCWNCRGWLHRHQSELA